MYLKTLDPHVHCVTDSRWDIHMITESSTNSISELHYMYVLIKNTNLHSPYQEAPRRTIYTYMMTMRSMSLLLLLVASISSISTLVAPEAANDEAALLAFKAAAISGNEYGNALASWNQSISYCSWGLGGGEVPWQWQAPKSGGA